MSKNITARYVRAGIPENSVSPKAAGTTSPALSSSNYLNRVKSFFKTDGSKLREILGITNER